MKTKISLTVFFISLSSYGSVFDFSQCLIKAQENNPEIKSISSRIDSANSSIKAARGAYFPSVVASLGYEKSSSEKVENDSYIGSLNFTQNIFSGFADVASVDVAKAQARRVLSETQSLRAQLSYDLKSSFAAMIYAQDYLQISQSIRSRRSENLDMVKLRFQSGRENRGSVLLAEAYLAQAELDVLKAENALQVARAQLARVMGSDVKELGEFTVQGKVPVMERLQTVVVETEVEKNPLVKSAEASYDQGAASQKVYQGTYFPSLDLKGSVGNFGEEFYPEKDRWSMGVTLSWSLFSGGRDYFKERSQAYERTVLENSYQNTKREVYASLQNALAGAKEAAKQLQVSEAFEKAGSVRAEIARSKYNNGLTTFDEWDRIENDLISYKRDLLIKQRDKVVAEANWEKARGVGVMQ